VSTAIDASSPTKQRIVEAAKRCMSRWGTQKSSMNDIAREAGVSRNTLYCHFTNRDEVIAATMLQAGNDFANRLINHISSFTSSRDRVVEGTMFALTNMLDEPYLGLVNSPDLAAAVNHALESAEGVQLVYAVTEKMLEFEPQLKNDIVEIAEVMTRLLLSMVLIKGPVARDTDATRAFLVRRLLPAIGL